MNLDRVRFPSLLPPPPAKSVGRRIDVTLASPAVPGKGESASTGPEASQIGSIQGVLTSEENRAIAALFGPGKQVYTASGAPQQQRAVLGACLDFQA